MVDNQIEFSMYFLPHVAMAKLEKVVVMDKFSPIEDLETWEMGKWA